MYIYIAVIFLKTQEKDNSIFGCLCRMQGNVIKYTVLYMQCIVQFRDVHLTSAHSLLKGRVV